MHEAKAGFTFVIQISKSSPLSGRAPTLHVQQKQGKSNQTSSAH